VSHTVCAVNDPARGYLPIYDPDKLEPFAPVQRELAARAISRDGTIVLDTLVLQEVDCCRGEFLAFGTADSNRRPSRSISSGALPACFEFAQACRSLAERERLGCVVPVVEDGHLLECRRPFARGEVVDLHAPLPLRQHRDEEDGERSFFCSFGKLVGADPDRDPRRASSSGRPTFDIAPQTGEYVHQVWPSLTVTCAWGGGPG
jgi:hypothetical protein